MTDTQVVRTALRRAAGRTSAAVAVRVAGEPCGSGAFVVPSASTPGHSWTVFWVTDGVSWCGCPDFAHRETCRHVAQAALAVEIEARQEATPASRAAAAAKLKQLEEMFS